MSMWRSKPTSIKVLQEIEGNNLLGQLKIIDYYDGSSSIKIAIDLDSMKSYILEYKERIG